VAETRRDRRPGPTADPGHDEQRLQAPAPHPHYRLAMLAVAGICVAGALGLGLLNLLGAGTGPVVNVVAGLTLVATFVGAVLKALQDDFQGASRRRRGAYVAVLVGGVALILTAGVWTRAAAPLHRMPGTADVAVVGLLAPAPEEQQEYDDVAASLADAIPTAADAEVHDYAGDTDAPLDLLRSAATRPQLDGWLADFLSRTDAELVVAGYADRAGEPGQTALHMFVYVPWSMASDAGELTGWFTLDDFLTDGSLDSRSARRALVDKVVRLLRGLAAFLDGLDAWQAGSSSDAISAFGENLRGDDGSSGTLRDLSHLFRGHALESRSEAVAPAGRARLLRSARADYEAIPARSPIAARARLSLASNAYLRAVQGGCTARNPAVGTLRRSSEMLDAIGANPTLPELLRRKAQVNSAQILMCRWQAGERDAAARLDALLPQLTQLSVPRSGVDRAALRQVKAHALSIEATRLAHDGQLSRAIDAISDALALDPRFERQGLWLGLKSGWLLADCRVEEGAATQQRALVQVRMAEDDGRAPNGEAQRYAEAFRSDLRSAHRHCGSTE
jgi:hypothetical protein